MGGGAHRAAGSAGTSVADAAAGPGARLAARADLGCRAHHHDPAGDRDRDLAAAADHIQRPAELGELEISVTPRGQMTRELATEFAQAGVHRLVLLAPPATDGPARTIETAAAAISGL